MIFKERKENNYFTELAIWSRLHLPASQRLTSWRQNFHLSTKSWTLENIFNFRLKENVKRKSFVKLIKLGARVCHTADICVIYFQKQPIKLWNNNCLRLRVNENYSLYAEIIKETKTKKPIIHLCLPSFSLPAEAEHEYPSFMFRVKTVLTRPLFGQVCA